MTRALLFDIGNVLIRFDPGIALRQLAPRSPHSPEEMAMRLKQWSRIPDYECGRMSTEEFFAETCSYLELSNLSLEEFTQVWCRIFLDEMPVSPVTVRSLKKRYRLVLISNTNAMHFGFIRQKFPVLAEFDDAVLSFQIGAMKPASAIFLEAVDRSGSGPAESFLIDDMEENISAARSLGIPGVRFDNETQLLGEFEQKGILA
ncbi:MAG: HAD family phosphatase [Acidobacteria bacterium]|nr:HAD family phosphatase [Acidobacteriota bacterium]